VTTRLSIREATVEHIATMLEWAAAEGWNPGIDDAAAFRLADLSGFFMGFLDKQPVASISVVKYDAHFAFLGLYIARPEFRGHGYGKAIWDHAVATASDRTIGLDGVVAQQENYRKSGFVLAHSNIRFGGRIVVRERPPRARPVAHDMLDDVLRYDRRFFPARRGAFLSNWLTGDSSRMALASVTDGEISGYGVIRRCLSGHKIGPLFANDPAIAVDLLQELVLRAGASDIVLDVPEPNREGIALGREMGLGPVFETARMYRGEPPDLPLRHIYGITSLELG
jgi:GNAT superfamily N-acetyltransferase